VDLNLVQMIFVVEADNADVALYYQALRRFDQFFKQSCCRYVIDSCHECKENTDCPYLAVFAQELSTDPDIVRRHQKPPLPFAFKIMQISSDCSSLEICLVVVGKAVNHLDVFIKTVRRLVATIPVQNHGNPPDISGVYCQDNQSVRLELDLSSHGTRNVIVLSSLDIMENPVGADDVRLVIESPLRLLSGGSELRHFDFSAFLRSQMRRCSSLFAYYGDGELEIDFAGLSSDAKQVVCLCDGIRYSHPPWSQRPNHAGLFGASRFVAVTPGIMSLLTLGGYFNAGKVASFGFGTYSIKGL